MPEADVRRNCGKLTASSRRYRRTWSSARWIDDSPYPSEPGCGVWKLLSKYTICDAGTYAWLSLIQTPDTSPVMRSSSVRPAYMGWTTFRTFGMPLISLAFSYSLLVRFVRFPFDLFLG